MNAPGQLPRGLASLALLAVALCGCGQRPEPVANQGPATNRQPGKKETPDAETPEMKWGLEIARLFLDKVAAGQFDSAERMVVLGRKGFIPGSLLANDLRVTLGGTGNAASPYNPGDEFTSWEITSKLLSPTKDEASFRGSMQGPKRTATFTVQIMKEKTDGKWRVSEFTAVTKKK